MENKFAFCVLFQAKRCNKDGNFWGETTGQIRTNRLLESAGVLYGFRMGGNSNLFAWHAKTQTQPGEKKKNPSTYTLAPLHNRFLFSLYLFFAWLTHPFCGARCRRCMYA